MVFGYGVGGVAVDPQNPDILYTGPYDLHVSTDGGATWTVRNNGLTCHQIYSIAINPTNPSIVFAAGFISQNIFVTKLNPSGGIVFSTYLGGTGGARWLGDSKYAGGIAVDSSGNVYVDGATYSDDFPITTNAYQTLHAGNIYLSKFNATGSQLLYSTCFGSDSYESADGIRTAFTR